jgi:hypothetical protein
MAREDRRWPTAAVRHVTSSATGWQSMTLARVTL